MKIVVITMVGGLDVIGELESEPRDMDVLKLGFPCVIQMPKPNTVGIHPLLRGSPVYAGTYVMINMRNVMWINDPADALRKAYQASRAGLAVPEKFPVEVNG